MRVPIILIAAAALSIMPSGQNIVTQRTGHWERHNDESTPSPYSCRVESLRTSFSFGNPPIEIEKNGIVTAENGTSFSSIVLRNVHNSSMNSLILVVEYLGEPQDEPFFTVADGVVVPSGEQAFNPSFPMQSVDAMVAPLGPGASVRIQGTANGIRMFGCPVAARVTRMRVQFSDGRSQDWSASGWRLDPSIAHVPDVSDFRPNGVSPPVALSAVLKIDSAGRVTEMSPSGEQPALIEYFRKRFLRELRFHPALLDGQPVASQLSVLVRLHSQRSLEFPADLDTRTAVTLIDIFPKESPESGWTISYGGLSGGSTIP